MSLFVQKTPKFEQFGYEEMFLYHYSQYRMDIFGVEHNGEKEEGKGKKEEINFFFGKINRKSPFFVLLLIGIFLVIIIAIIAIIKASR